MQTMKCKHCDRLNPWVYYAPTPGNGIKGHRYEHATCVCLDCADKRGWINHKTGNLAEGVSL